MRKLFYLLLFFVLISCQKEEKGGLLWEISGNGLKKSSYLFGTWHGDAELRNASFLDSVPGFQKAFASAEQFVYEGSYTPENVQELIMMPADTTYADLLDEAEIQLLDSLLNVKLHGDLVRQKTLRPSTLGSMVSYIMVMQRVEERLTQRVKALEEANRLEPDSLFYEKRNAIYAERDVMDIQLTKRAQKRHLPICGLDSIIKFFLDIPTKSSLKEDAKDLIKVLSANNDSMYIQMNELTLPMRKAYRAQDINDVSKYKELQVEGIIKAFASSGSSNAFTKEDVDKLLQEILVERNKTWMKHLPGILADKSSFIAVGAVHLPSDEGLINLLRKKGYTVKPVTE